DDDFEMITSELKKNDANVKALYTANNSQLTVRSAPYLSEMIEATTKLVKISFDEKSIDDTWAIQIALAMKVNRSVKTLWLHHCRIKDEGAKALGEALAINHTLTDLGLNFNPIHSGGAAALAMGLQQNATLTFLNMRGLSKTSEGAKALLNAKSGILRIDF
ncbi:unnamed protein product, partial [Didymodactylos carnosus]